MAIFRLNVQWNFFKGCGRLKIMDGTQLRAELEFFKSLKRQISKIFQNWRAIYKIEKLREDLQETLSEMPEIYEKNMERKDK